MIINHWRQRRWDVKIPSPPFQKINSEKKDSGLKTLCGLQDRNPDSRFILREEYIMYWKVLSRRDFIKHLSCRRVL
jgi:hypothetical protein